MNSKKVGMTVLEENAIKILFECSSHTQRIFRTWDTISRIAIV